MNAIVAIGENGEIGKGGALPWKRTDADLRWFQFLTVGHDVIVGPKTNRLLPPLPYRCVHVLQPVDGVLCEPPSMTMCRDRATAFVAGGLKTYQTYRMDITDWFISRLRINCHDADVYFDNSLLHGFFKASEYPLDNGGVAQHWIRSEWLVPTTAWQT